jgi:hypothetical protein
MMSMVRASWKWKTGPPEALRTPSMETLTATDVLASPMGLMHVTA